MVRFGDRRAVFEHGAWSGIRPRLAVYDSVFVNESMFSADAVTTEHLKNHYGMVVGEGDGAAEHGPYTLEHARRDLPGAAVLGALDQDYDRARLDLVDGART